MKASVVPVTTSHPGPPEVPVEPLPAVSDVRPWERSWSWDELRGSVDKWTLSSDSGVSYFFWLPNSLLVIEHINGNVWQHVQTSKGAQCWS